LSYARKKYLKKGRHSERASSKKIKVKERRNPRPKIPVAQIMKTGGYTYIMTNKRHSVLYTGVTASLMRRVAEHKEKSDPKCFTAKYNCNKLVYYKGFQRIEEAIAEEKRIKGLSRSKKQDMIFAMNPQWRDMALDDIDL
jgi:putative endonuclease